MESLTPQDTQVERAQLALTDLLDQQAFENEAVRLNTEIAQDTALAQYSLSEKDILALTREGYKVPREQQLRIFEGIAQQRTVQDALPEGTYGKHYDIRRREKLLEQGIRLLTDDEPEAQPLVGLLADAVSHQDALGKPAPFMDYAKNTPEAWKHVPTAAIKDYFAGRLFAKISRFEKTSDRSVVLESKDDEPLEVPANAFVYLQSFNSWLGDGIEGAAGHRIASPRYPESENGGSTSLDTIKHYASLLTEIPPVDNVQVYIQPNGIILADNGQGDSHRIAAALLRGQDTIKASSVTFKLLAKNEVVKTRDGQMMLAADANKEPEWEDVAKIVEKLGFSDDVKLRAEQFKHVTAAELAAMITSIHDVLAPNYDNVPTDTPARIIGKTQEGKRVKRFLMNPDQRFAFLEYVSEQIQKAGKNVPEGSEEAYLERVAYSVALATVLTHPFEDGNGRTSRALADLIEVGHKAGETMSDDFQLLAKTRPLPGSPGVRINGFVPNKSETADPHEVITNILAPNIPLKNSDEYDKHKRTVIFGPFRNKTSSVDANQQ